MSIGGPLTAANYALLASLHRPTDPKAIASEVRRLNSQGFTAIDISTALRMNVAVVREMLATSLQS
ncbi:MAG TPA: hypothetical protein VK629_12525 [Steroidobacteraceae bacterium]|nr:hypothetical protein [Steroidobacteraceae bacterium]